MKLDKATIEYRALYQGTLKIFKSRKITQTSDSYAQLHQAREIDEEILKADPNDNDALIDRGELQIRAGDLVSRGLAPNRRQE